MIRKILLFFFVISPFVSLSSQCWKEVTTGGAHTLALTTNNQIVAWGNNTEGQLGNGSVSSFSITPTQIGTDTNWQSIASGFSHNLAIKNDGTLWAWGDNSKGECGTGNTNSPITTPTQIGTDTDWKTISGGNLYSVAIKTDGTLWAWGYNNTYQLGNGLTADIYTPTQINTDTDWKFISAGETHCFAVKNNGTLWGWGDNTDSKLGNNSTLDLSNPTQIGVDNDWKEVLAGDYHSIGLKNDGSVWAWGLNTNSRLGDGTSINRTEPFKISGANIFIRIARGTDYGVVIKNDNTLWTWGTETAGQLGNGTPVTGTITTPTQIGTLTNWSQIVANKTFSFAIKTDNSLHGWGANVKGQIGVAPQTTKSAPTQVTCPTTLSSEEVIFAKISIFPNPVINTLNVRNNENLSFKTIKIVDLSGKVVVTETYSSEEINVERLTKGIYFLFLNDGEKDYQSKFIKM